MNDSIIKKDILRSLLHFALARNLLHHKSHIEAVQRDRPYLTSIEAIEIMYSYGEVYFNNKKDAKAKELMKWAFDMFNFFSENDGELELYIRDPDSYNIDRINIKEYNRDKYINFGDSVKMNLLTEWNMCNENKSTFRRIFTKLL